MTAYSVKWSAVNTDDPDNWQVWGWVEVEARDPEHAYDIVKADPPLESIKYEGFHIIYVEES